MPQTEEAIEHAQAAGFMIVAVNKIDKENADPEKVQTELGKKNVIPEEWGGDTIFIKISALTGEGIDQLLEAISLQSEILELKASSKGSAIGSVVESSLDKEEPHSYSISSKWDFKQKIMSWLAKSSAEFELCMMSLIKK